MPQADGDDWLRPILWHVMKYYAHFGHKEFILCLGHVET
jgi:NDP-sugar pyrophosphorylase family protein